MGKINKIFFEKYCNDNFAEFISDIQLSLEDSNKNYNSFINRRKKLLDKYPNVRSVIESEECKSLTQREVKALYDYICLMDNCSIIFEKELFLRGMAEAYLLFKKLDLLK